MKLSGRQVAELQDALLDAFTFYSLRQMVRFELDRHLAHIAGGQNFTEIVFNLVEWAEQQERVDDLVDGAQRFNPTNRSLQVVAQRLALATPKPPALPCFDWAPVRAGGCLIGSDPARDSAARADEMPLRECDVPFFRIARTPVTNVQYEQFVDAMGYRVPRHWVDGKIPPGKEAHPVVHLSFEDAQAFCSWAGVRLPTEVEWEKAARGTTGRIYPWGDEPPTPERANYGQHGEDTTSVMRHPAGASSYGCLNMAGNAWEWTSSLWPSEAAQTELAAGSTLNAGVRVQRILKGGYYTRGPQLIRAAYRYRALPTYRKGIFGLRVVALTSNGSALPCF